YEHVKFLRKRQQILPEQSTDGQSEGCEGKLANPMPLDSAFPENQHSTYAEDE
ncbi:hypothetical protein LCGC14_2282130, partial [marine sediment metagenome]